MTRQPPPLLAAMLCGLAITAMPAQASQKLAEKGGCPMCHAADRKVLGPSYKEIAARYKGQAGAPAMLAERVRKGSKGVWGPLPMTPTGPDKLSDAELNSLIGWVLKTP